MKYRISNNKNDIYIRNISKQKLQNFPGVYYQCEYSSGLYSDSMVNELLGSNLPQSLSKAVTKRKAEFVAGRYMAKRALTSLKSKDITVGISKNREPIWPQSFTGSISHTQDIAICAVTCSDQIKSLGIDVENILNKKVCANIAASILTQPEYRLIGSLQNPDENILTLIFSAKESLFKALYSEVGYYFDFSAAKVISINYKTGRFTIELIKHLTPLLPNGSLFNGAFKFDKHRVFTMIIQSSI